MLGAILPQVSHKDQHIQTTSRAANNALIRLVKKTPEKVVMKVYGCAIRDIDYLGYLDHGNPSV